MKNDNFFNTQYRSKHILENFNLKNLKFEDVNKTNYENTASFYYSNLDSPLISTQQLNVDWSNFENHTFFAPATVNTNISFHKIINEYPFDGSRKEVEEFFEKLSGYEKWVFDQFPKYRGALHFSGTLVGEDVDGTLGTFITVHDKTGLLFPNISKTTEAKPVLGPLEETSWALEMQLHVPTIANDVQTILQKKNNSNVGYSLILTSSTSTNYFTASFSIFSGSRHITVNDVIGEKGRYEHVCFNYLNEDNEQRIEAWVNEENISITSLNYSYIGTLKNQLTNLIIGSGSSYTSDIVVLPKQTLSASIDELRIFSELRTQENQRQFAKKSIFQDENTLLYFKFNEPTPPLHINGLSNLDSIVLDSSGNSLHSRVSNFTGSLRIDAEEDSLNPMIYEKLSLSPILFPGYSSIISLNEELLLSASLYDEKNPNLITRLVPPHFFHEGQAFQGLENEFGKITTTYSGSSTPGTGKLGSNQVFASLLYVYARFFDDLKLFCDQFSTIDYADYDEYDTVPDNFLIRALESYGFEVPQIFSNATLEQYFDAENTSYEYSTSTHTFKHIQTKILRRLLTNLRSIIRSKGTLYSIKSFMRSIGLDPNTSVRIREYGGPTERTLDYSRELRYEPIKMLKFYTSSLVVSPYLSSSRIEVGFPEQQGSMVGADNTFIHGISDNVSDGLLTSGSWTIETIFDFPLNVKHETTQSVIRLCSTGSNDSDGGIIANILVMSASSQADQTTHLYLRSGLNTDSNLLHLFVSGTSIFDGDKWTVSFGRARNDDPMLDTTISSSFFLRIGKQINGNIIVNKTTSSFFLENGGSVFETINSASNASGSYISMGENQDISIGSTADYRFLNHTISASAESRVLQFSGRQSYLKFWSKYISDSEWNEHLLNFKSTGVENPLTNWNYMFQPTGSFSRLRINSINTQDDLSSSVSGVAEIIDYSGNDFHLLASGYPTSSVIFDIDFYERSAISSLFDEFSCDDKIRIRSFKNLENITDFSVAGVAPIYETQPSEIPNDDRRFSIEFSLIDALNRDIITIFSTLDEIDDAIGSTNLLYSVDYPKLEKLRDVYFNRLTEKLNFKSFFDFFKWFDVSLTTFVEQLLPKKTIFKGVKFVVESHLLERHKAVYPIDDQRLGVKRQGIKNKLFLQNFVGEVKKY